MSQKPGSRSERGLIRLSLSLAVIGLVLLLAVAIVYYWERVAHLETYGYAGAFAISLLGTATILVPVPAMAVVFTLGGVLKYPLLLGLVVGVAEPLGELTGYMAGMASRSALESKQGRFYRRLQKWMLRRGGWVIFVLAAFPNPFFDLVGAIAGSFRYPLRRFLLFCWAGKTIKGLMVAFAGAWGLSLIRRWLELIGL
ncbi:MAG: VTT domain-containing protein [Dehalococcoidia bacterium]